MRSDDVGMFWEDLPQRTTRGEVIRPQPEIPDTGWVPPREFPNLRTAPYISLDVETYDPELLTRGPGWGRRASLRPEGAPSAVVVAGSGSRGHSGGAGGLAGRFYEPGEPRNPPNQAHLVGVSVAVPGYSWYFPMRHAVEPEYNVDPCKVLAWLADTLGNAAQPKVGANLLYDIGWLREEGVDVAGPCYDVQFAEALLTETGKVELDTLAEKYLGENKETSLLYQWCANYFGGTANGKQRANIWRSPPRLAGPYAEADASLPARIIEHQYKALAQQGLVDLFHLECRSIPMLIDMRFKGARVDVDKAHTVDAMLSDRIEAHQQELDSIAGRPIDVNSADDLGVLFDTLGISYYRTKKTRKPSITKDFLKVLAHPSAAAIRNVRAVTKLRDTFIRSYIIDSNVNGRIHAQFHPLRAEAYGTRSGRFSSSHPNLQNIPSRDSDLAPMVRGLFVPDIGHKQWRKNDYSQIEYRFLVEYARGPGADDARQRYLSDPLTDYHKLTQLLVQEQTGQQLDRGPVKNINFGLVYGMGIPALAALLGITVKRARELFSHYHKGLPFVGETLRATAEEVNQLGYITTILGRRSRFDLWEPLEFSEDKKPAMPFEQALLAYGQVKRAGTHKALNRRLQGSAADLIKKGMVDCYEAGLFNELLPALTVHDELDFSDPGDRDEQFREIRNVMETCIPLRVPIVFGNEVGPDWGHVQEEEY